MELDGFLIRRSSRVDCLLGLVARICATADERVGWGGRRGAVEGEDRSRRGEVRGEGPER